MVFWCFGALLEKSLKVKSIIKSIKQRLDDLMILIKIKNYILQK